MVKKKIYFYYVLYLMIILVMIAALVWFRFVWLAKYSVKAYTSTTASFHASDKLDTFKLQSPRSQALVVHFIDPSCPCSKYSVPYIEKLQQDTVGKSEHVFVEKESSSEIKESGIKSLLEVLPASPAVAIWNTEGRLAYFGAYSSGEYCGDGEDMVRYALDSMVKNKDFSWIDQEAQGCMCKWKGDLN